MAELGSLSAERLEQLDLHGRVGDVVLAANHMGDAELDVVDHRGQRVEVGPVLAAQDRVGQRAAIDAALAAHHVGPADRSGIEAEAPVRLPARGLERGAVGVGQAKRGAVVDRRTPERLLALAPAVELLRRLVGRIKSPERLEFLGRGVVEGHPFRLSPDEIGLDAEPGEVLLDRSGVFGLRAFEVGVVEAEDERAAVAAGEQPVQQGRAGVSDVDAPGRRGGEADDRSRIHEPS